MKARTLLLPALMLAAAGLLAWRVLQPVSSGVDARVFAAGPRDSQPVAGIVRAKAGASAARPPNIVVILADDLGWGDPGVQGGRVIATPNIDQLARDGVRLTDFYASAPICTPSRAGLLTGRYPLRSGFSSVLAAADDTFLRSAVRRVSLGFAKLGVTDTIGGESLVKGLPLSEITIAEALRVRGYRTLAVGKWHLGDFTRYPEFHPARHGFEHFFGYNMANDDFPVALWRDQQQLLANVGVLQSSHTREFTEEALKYIAAWRDGPFFIYLAHKDPHQPFFPSPAFAGKSRGGPYGDAVSEFDWSVGEVMKALRREGIAEDTLVVLSSDNGPWYEGATGGLRGRKGQSYEGGFRVPFIAAWPARIPAGSVSEVPAMNIDLLPTFLGIAGLEPPADRVIDGIDILPLLTGTGDKRSAGQRPLYFFHEYEVEAVRQGQWKYIASNSHYTWPLPLDKTNTVAGRTARARDYRPADGGPPVPTLGSWPMLYDLGIDREEAYNVAAREPAVTQRLAAQLAAWQREFTAAPRGWKD